MFDLVEVFTLLFNRYKSTMATAETALPGRDRPILSSPAPHTVLGTPIVPPYPDGFEVLDVGLGCFWGAERMFWKVPGVYTTAVGYAGGFTPNPTYEEVCSGRTGHTEAVRVVYDPAKVSALELFKVFWEGHDPTQGMAQGNDVGTQYRSAIFYSTEAQKAAAEQTRETFGAVLGEAGFGAVTTEIVPAGPFYFAEDEHQQYLDKVPWGYCPDHGTGNSCPIGLGVNQQG